MPRALGADSGLEQQHQSHFWVPGGSYTTRSTWMQTTTLPCLANFLAYTLRRTSLRLGPPGSNALVLGLHGRLIARYLCTCQEAQESLCLLACVRAIRSPGRQACRPTCRLLRYPQIRLRVERRMAQVQVAVHPVMAWTGTILRYSRRYLRTCLNCQVLEFSQWHFLDHP